MLMDAVGNKKMKLTDMIDRSERPIFSANSSPKCVDFGSIFKHMLNFTQQDSVT